LGQLRRNQPIFNRCTPWNRPGVTPDIFQKWWERPRAFEADAEGDCERSPHLFCGLDMVEVTGRTVVEAIDLNQLEQAKMPSGKVTARHLGEAASMGHQHGNNRRLEHCLRDAAEKAFSQTRVAIAAHHQQIG
jgi:hypothetical protein